MGIFRQLIWIVGGDGWVYDIGSPGREYEKVSHESFKF